MLLSIRIRSSAIGDRIDRADLGASAAYKTIILDNAVLLPLLGYRSGRTRLHALAALDARLFINLHPKLRLAAGQAEYGTVWTEVSVPELLREEEGQGEAQSYRDGQDGELLPRLDGKGQDPKEQSKHQNPHPDLLEEAGHLETFDMQFLLRPGQWLERGVYRTDPTTIEAGEDERSQG